MKRMTPDIEASRRIDRDHAGGLHGSCMASICAERHFLLAEVDRLTLTVLPEAIARACHDCKDGAVKDERARILVAVEAQTPDGTKARDFAYALGWDNAIAAVIAAIEGETA